MRHIQKNKKLAEINTIKQTALTNNRFYKFRFLKAAKLCRINATKLTVLRAANQVFWVGLEHCSIMAKIQRVQRHYPLICQSFRLRCRRIQVVFWNLFNLFAKIALRIQTSTSFEVEKVRTSYQCRTDDCQ